MWANDIEAIADQVAERGYADDVKAQAASALIRLAAKKLRELDTEVE
jgi:hypothetical protein